MIVSITSLIATASVISYFVPHRHPCIPRHGFRVTTLRIPFRECTLPAEPESGRCCLDILSPTYRCCICTVSRHGTHQPSKPSLMSKHLTTTLMLYADTRPNASRHRHNLRTLGRSAHCDPNIGRLYVPDRAVSTKYIQALTTSHLPSILLSVTCMSIQATRQCVSCVYVRMGAHTELGRWTTG